MTYIAFVLAGSVLFLLGLAFRRPCLEEPYQIPVDPYQPDMEESP